MMRAYSTSILVLATTASALMAGLFYAYSFSVNPGLHQLPDIQYIVAMQSINREIQNPVFFAGFFGALLLLPLSAYVQYSHPLSLRFKLLLAAAFAYAIGVMGVTIFGNVPLNDMLDAFDLKTASPEEITGKRTQFENLWNGLNWARTGSSLLAVVLAILACLNPLTHIAASPPPSPDTRYTY